MGCLTVTYTRLDGIAVDAERVGGITADTERIGGIICSTSRIGGISAAATRIGGMSARMDRNGGMTCRFALICDTGSIAPYLEINPEIIWVFPDWAVDNDVFSNTRWKVD